MLKDVKLKEKHANSTFYCKGGGKNPRVQMFGCKEIIRSYKQNNSYKKQDAHKNIHLNKCKDFRIELKLLCQVVK